MKCADYAKKLIELSKDGRPLPLNWKGAFQECDDFPKPNVLEFILDTSTATCILDDVTWIGRLPKQLNNKKWKIVATEILE